MSALDIKWEEPGLQWNYKLLYLLTFILASWGHKTYIGYSNRQTYYARKRGRLQLPQVCRNIKPSECWNRLVALNPRVGRRILLSPSSKLSKRTLKMTATDSSDVSEIVCQYSWRNYQNTCINRHSEVWQRYCRLYCTSTVSYFCYFGTPHTKYKINPKKNIF